MALQASWRRWMALRRLQMTIAAGAVSTPTTSPTATAHDARNPLPIAPSPSAADCRLRPLMQLASGGQGPQGSSPDPAGSSPKFEILKPGPCWVSPGGFGAALEHGYAMSCVVTNSHLPSGST